ncbi:hypothetical protein RB195_012357 [Necator americanus]|uniref:Uncharacterized protein n=1 Tax=Necator americanus TaxID=51031 RepID=A0ABR1D7J6_NECAM
MERHSRVECARVLTSGASRQLQSRWDSLAPIGIERKSYNVTSTCDFLRDRTAGCTSSASRNKRCRTARMKPSMGAYSKTDSRRSSWHRSRGHAMSFEQPSHNNQVL